MLERTVIFTQKNFYHNRNTKKLRKYVVIFKKKNIAISKSNPGICTQLYCIILFNPIGLSNFPQLVNILVVS